MFSVFVFLLGRKKKKLVLTCVCVCVCVCVCLSHLTLCHAMDYSSSGSRVHGISQAIILEWIAISSSRGPSQGLSLCFLALQADSLPLSHPGSPNNPNEIWIPAGFGTDYNEYVITVKSQKVLWGRIHALECKEAISDMGLC